MKKNAPLPPLPTKSQVFKFRIDHPTKQLITRAARHKKLPLSVWVRQTLLAAAEL